MRHCDFLPAALALAAAVDAAPATPPEWIGEAAALPAAAQRDLE